MSDASISDAEANRAIDDVLGVKNKPSDSEAQQAAEQATQEAKKNPSRDAFLAMLQETWSDDLRTEFRREFAAQSEGEALKVLTEVLNLKGSLTDEQRDTNLFFVVKELLLHDPKYIVVAATPGITDAQREFLENKSLVSATLALINGKVKFEDLTYSLQPTPAATKAATAPAAPPVLLGPPVSAKELAVELGISLVDVLAFAGLTSGNADTLVSRSKVVAAIAAAKAAAAAPKPTEQPKQNPPKPKPVDTTKPKPVDTTESKLRYAPTADEQSAEATFMGLIMNGMSDYDELFTRFFVDTRRSGWPHAFLDYLEDKYADSIVM